MHTFAEFRALVLQLVEGVGTSFSQPDDDWVPVVFWETRDKVDVMDAGRWFESDYHKDMFVEIVLPTIFKLEGVQQAAMVSSAWSVEVPVSPGPIEQQRAEVLKIRPSKRPDRQEMLMVTVGSRKEYEFWYAFIVRTENRPPRLKAWTQMPISAEIEGRFGDQPRTALRRADQISSAVL